MDDIKNLLLKSKIFNEKKKKQKREAERSDVPTNVGKNESQEQE